MINYHHFQLYKYMVMLTQIVKPMLNLTTRNVNFNVSSLHAYYKASYCYYILLGSFDLPVFQSLHCDEKSSMMHSNVSTIYLFIYLFTFYIFI